MRDGARQPSIHAGTIMIKQVMTAGKVGPHTGGRNRQVHLFLDEKI